MRAFWRSVGGRRVLGRNTRPLALNRKVGDHRDGGEWNGRCLKYMFIKDRAVQPDDVVILVLDLSGVDVTCRGRMGPEMAVGDRMVVPGLMFVDVLRRERRCEQQVRAGQKDCRGAGQRRPNHGLHY